MLSTRWTQNGHPLRCPNTISRSLKSESACGNHLGLGEHNAYKIQISLIYRKINNRKTKLKGIRQERNIFFYI